MRLERKLGFYEKYIKRLLDIICSLLAIIVFSWLYIIIAFVVRIKMGSPVIFKQPRPGLINPKTGRERIFEMYKFRTMTDERDVDGELLPDEARLPAFGLMLRATSLDELPEAFNILKGDMSVIGNGVILGQPGKSLIIQWFAAAESSPLIQISCWLARQAAANKGRLCCPGRSVLTQSNELKSNKEVRLSSRRAEKLVGY